MKTLDIIQEDIERRKKMDQWYYPRQRMVQRKQEGILLSAEDDSKNKWMGLAEELEAHLKNNELG